MAPTRRLINPLALLAGWAFLSTALAQPSGGPYGPIDQDYTLPAGAGTTYFVAPDGNAQSPGTDIDAPTTLDAAIARVVTDDAIILRGGTYRTGGLRLNQGVTIQPYRDERPVLKGTQVATEWEALRDGVWRTKWETLFPTEPMGWWRRNREGMRTPLHRFDNDMVFLDGVHLRSVGWEGELDETSYFIDQDNGYVYLGTDPTDRLVEITAHDGAIIRTSADVHGKSNDGQGPVIRGLKITQYAYRCLEVEGKRQITMHEEPTDEPVGLKDPSEFGKDITGTVLENLDISYCSRVAGYFRGDGLVIRNTLVSDTGTEGIYVIGSSDVLLEKNIIRRNNIENLTGYYASAVKIFNQTRRVTFRDNLVIDHPNSNGVWYDVGNRDGVIINNWIENTHDGFMFEISDGATVAGNVFVDNYNGVFVLNAANVKVYHNTFINSSAEFRRDRRGDGDDHFGWHVTTGPGVEERDGHVFVNNLLVVGPEYERPLLEFEQPAELCDRLDQPQADIVDGNVYVRDRTILSGSVLVQLSPAGTENCIENVTDLDALETTTPGWEAHGQVMAQSLRTVFKGPDLGRFNLREPIETQSSDRVPAEVLELLGWRAGEAATVGAYPGRD
ncbi:right-handed parallel beta-helix repeat-containing protein [Marinihelvus fidelis]|uniref:Right-handed parallel beta-helix repeat-containing protein n=1 Tax=Marinihelvus fidelis TaxID=2613842 RepID=A0A5N0TJS9_9GAMM|nr:right-handed parallel beta-helix repeat-containing protein [Marinihelvus fidelis]KAA9134176.1 right-handed parallel beta-helix repeat-containing protein [Marinihelvus fidelis]